MREEEATPIALPQGSQPGESGWDAGVFASLRAAWHELKALAHDQLQLAAVEAQQAGRSAFAIVVYGVVAGVLIASAWLGVLAIVVMTLVAFGIHAVVALALVVTANGFGVLACLLTIRHRCRDLGFPATLRSLAPGPSERALAERES